MRGRVLPYGAEAVLVEVDGTAAALGLATALGRLLGQGDPDWAGVDSVVPGACTVLVMATPTVVAGLAPMLLRLLAVTEPVDLAHAERLVVIPVTYDGADLAEVAALTGLSEAGVVAAHTGTPWTVGFTGFSPGFAYLVGGDPRLNVPRRGSPRTNVPGGTVALAGPYSAVYPRSGPGGWQLIGRTRLAVWGSDGAGGARLTPGTEVRFEVAS